MLDELPQRNHRTRRIENQRHPTGAHHIERLHHQRPARGNNPSRRRIDIVDIEVRAPARGDALLNLLRALAVNGSGVHAVELRHRVKLAVAHVVVLVRPAEQLRIKRLGAGRLTGR